MNKLPEKDEIIMGEKFSKLHYSHYREHSIALRDGTVRWTLGMSCKVLYVSQVMHSLC